MKKLLLLLVAFPVYAATSQDFSGLREISFTTAEECRAYDGKALECSQYILNTPFDENDRNRLLATQFVLSWMEATADFKFSIGTSIIDLTGTNAHMFGLAMAAMTKFSLENKEKAKDEKAVTLNSVKMVLEYCKKSENNLKPNKELKRAIKADEEGKLLEYLKL